MLHSRKKHVVLLLQLKLIQEILLLKKRGVKISMIWDSGFKNKYFTSNFPLLFHLSIHEYMKYNFGLFLTQFWVNDVTTRVKTAIFWERDLRNKLLTSKFHQILMLIFLSPSIHDMQLCVLFIQFGDNDVTKEINIPEFWKIN